MASAFLFACSESDDPSPIVDNSIPEGSVVFDISTVNKLNNGMSRGNVYSQEATQHVTRVSVYAFSNNGSDYVYAKTYDISGWSDGTTFKRYVVAEGDKLPAGDYKFLAVGRDAADQFTVSGTTTAQVLDKGSRVSIEMTRKVAGVLGYFKNVPQILDGKTVTFLRLSASNSNQQVNLTNGVGVNTSPAAYNIIDLNLSGQTVTNGIYTGNNLSAQGVVKVANSQLSGSYFMPVSSVTLTLGLYEANGNAIKTWSVKDTGGVTTFNILANHFYSLGMKVQAGNVNGGTDDPGDDDDPIDLLTDQNIVITISPAWELIHNLIIQ